jgi:dihydropteroate synthase
MADHIYLRPLGLVFGPDAKILIAQGDAGSLGGSDQIAFTQVDLIIRNGARSMRSYRDMVDLPEMHAITRKRGPLAGLDLATCRVMGIVNVTPDSFSDGGQLDGAEVAIVRAGALASDGADILDIGGESTRPGSESVSEAVELDRVLPVIKAIAGKHLVSIDTRNAPIMSAAAAAGARIINDVSALRHDEYSMETVARLQLPVVLMHAQGEPKTMQLAPKYDNVVLDVYDVLEERVAAAKASGLSDDQICVDPGIGFGKSFEHNMALMQSLTIFHGLGVGLLCGVSRKNMIGILTGEKVPANRVAGSVGGALHAAQCGAHVVRVHDVAATVQALKVVQACQNPDSVPV